MGPVAQAESNTQTKCLSWLKPSIPIHPVSPDPPRLPVLTLLLKWKKTSVYSIIIFKLDRTVYQNLAFRIICLIVWAVPLVPWNNFRPVPALDSHFCVSRSIKTACINLIMGAQYKVDFSTLFLVAFTQLYKSLCLSVGRLVGWSVVRSVHPSVLRSITPLLFWCFASSFCITAPAQPHVTVAVMYTASPTAPALQITAPAQHPRLMVSCIRPC